MTVSCFWRAGTIFEFACHLFVHEYGWNVLNYGSERVFVLIF